MEHKVDPLEKHLFPPELVMHHQKAIGLSKEQKGAIRKAVRQTQSTVTDLQWDLQDAMESMLELLSKESIDEKDALALFQQAMETETKMKRTHLTLAIRIKNLLTPEQQEQLTQLKRQRHEAHLKEMKHQEKMPHH